VFLFNDLVVRAKVVKPNEKYVFEEYAGYVNSFPRQPRTSSSLSFSDCLPPTPTDCRGWDWERCKALTLL